MLKTLYHQLRIERLVPTLLVLTVFVSLLMAMGESLRAEKSDQTGSSTAFLERHLEFTAPIGYFLPSLAETDPAKFDPTTSDFGLVPQSYEAEGQHERRHDDADDGNSLTNWARFAQHVEKLNRNAATGTKYHVLYLARHGQGYHNLAESYFGVNAWDCYWAELKGDPTSSIVWADAKLSKLGEKQAQEQAQFWAKQLTDQHMPGPAKWFVSPMERACKTLEITFQSLAHDGKVENWRPTVKELLRETNGIHTCDWRSPRSVIAQRYPRYQIEPGFTEDDELWDPVHRETNEAHTYRASVLLDDILGNEPATYISMTAHGGMINAILRAIGHREFQLRTGSSLAVLLKTEVKSGKRPTQAFGKGPLKPGCIGDPLKSGLPGYDNLKDYVDSVEAEVPPEQEIPLL